jgi:hypothetical protein
MQGYLVLQQVVQSTSGFQWLSTNYSYFRDTTRKNVTFVCVCVCAYIHTPVFPNPSSMLEPLIHLFIFQETPTHENAAWPEQDDRRKPLCHRQGQLCDNTKQ